MSKRKTGRILQFNESTGHGLVKCLKTGALFFLHFTAIADFGWPIDGNSNLPTGGEYCEFTTIEDNGSRDVESIVFGRQL